MNINELIEHWKHISPVIREPQNADEYDQLAGFLDKLLDIVGEDESHESVLEYLGELNSTTEHNIDLLSATDIDEIKLV